MKSPTSVFNNSTDLDNFTMNFQINRTRVNGVVTSLCDHDIGKLLQIDVIKLKNDDKCKKLIRNKEEFSRDDVMFNYVLEEESWLHVYNSSVDVKYQVFNRIFTS